MEQQNTAHFTSLEPNFLGEIKTPNHAFFVDEPAEQGGQGEYPQPRNYLLGALAACIGTTVRMYTQHKGWEVGKIEVAVELTEEVIDGKKHFSIHKDLVFENKKLTNEQVDRLIRVADRCPVSQIIAAPIEMTAEVVASLEEGPVKEYSNEDITVTWKPNRCIHSTKCWKGLLPVFNPKKRPWVNMEGADTETIIQQVDKCPSGALSYKKKS